MARWSVPILAAILVLSSLSAARGMEMEVRDGEGLRRVLSGEEVNGHVLDSGDTIVVAGEAEVLEMNEAPDAYYRGLVFSVRTSPARPPDKRQVTIRYVGKGKAALFVMAEGGRVDLSNIMLAGWNQESCCPVY